MQICAKEMLILNEKKKHLFFLLVKINFIKINT